MKSNDFQVNEGFKDVAQGALRGIGNVGKTLYNTSPFKGALRPLTDPFRNTQQTNNRKHKSLFVNDFAQQFAREHQRYPQLTLPDFMEMYWTKNNWDISKLAPSYKASLDSAMASTEAANFTTTSLQELGDKVYDIALRVTGINRQPEVLQPQQPQQTTVPQTPAAAQTAQPTQQPAATSSATGEIDNGTNQILSKIRSMRNTPDEVDDLIDIAAMTLIKLYKVSPKNYKRIILSLFNNGGRPNTSAAIDTAQQSTPTRQRRPAAERPMTAGGGKLDPNNPDDANLLNAIQNAQAQGR